MNEEVTSYIAKFPSEVEFILENIRAIILKIVPKVTESISYGMPAYKYKTKPLVYFAAYKNHIGFYATPSGHEQFKEALSVYKQGKGSVQFPLNQKIPYDLIEAIVKYRAAENETKN
ncbi:iron chaperone [Flavobacterium agrisoli]|uniref:DUF1801 domain-containing protein n=1 Tax=Flavobacterium agrisoli TaxID=2793066 RepID=A0A934PJV6_9FLAO|nr:DUF1801 domain-containing protein [Flavobacterium agrisoli]MBK0368709.1 DUF1801 domain-containing protein [Flavobacterium agrisoli]